MPDPLLVTLMRHGAVEGRPFVFRGAADPPLSALGWTQMERAYARAALPPPDAIATSPRARCRAFAERAAAGARLPLAIAPDLAEMSFGAWEELTGEEARALDAARYEAFRADPRAAAPPGGERYDEFAARVQAGLRALADGRTGHLLVVTHAGVIHAALAHALGLTAASIHRVALPPAATCRLSLLDGAAPVLLALNFAGEP